MPLHDWKKQPYWYLGSYGWPRGAYTCALCQQTRIGDPIPAGSPAVSGAYNPWNGLDTCPTTEELEASRLDSERFMEQARVERERALANLIESFGGISDGALLEAFGSEWASRAAGEGDDRVYETVCAEALKRMSRGGA